MKFKKNAADKLEYIIEKLKNYHVKYTLNFSAFDKLGDKGAKKLLSLLLENYIEVSELNLDFQDISDYSVDMLSNFIKRSPSYFVHWKQFVASVVSVPRINEYGHGYNIANTT